MGFYTVTTFYTLCYSSVFMGTSLGLLLPLPLLCLHDLLLVTTLLRLGYITFPLSSSSSIPLFHLSPHHPLQYFTNLTALSSYPSLFHPSPCPYFCLTSTSCYYFFSFCPHVPPISSSAHSLCHKCSWDSFHKMVWNRR